MLGLKYITREGLEALKDYKYTGIDLSILKILFLGRWWDFCANLLPEWLAPNLITFFGFCHLLSNFFLALYYCSSGTGCPQAPAWVYLFFGLNIFIYQTLDNIDGKQARKTGTSSPLGELFDHGCDSLFLMLTSVPFFLVFSPTNTECFVLISLGVWIFYLSHWVENYTGVLVLGRISNPTEVQLGMILLILSGIYPGPSWWNTTLKTALPSISSYFPELIQQTRMTRLLVWLIGILAVGTFIDNAREVYQDRKQKNKPFLQTYKTLVSYVLETILISIFALLPNGNGRWVDNGLVYVIVMHGLLTSMLCDQLLISRICKQEFHVINPILIIPAIGAFNVITGYFGFPLLNQTISLILLVALSFIIFSDFVLSVIQQLTTHLNIRCFKIPYNSEKKKNS
eukprot:TRINITY_DN8256_c0_g1_i1.p1 TRINITY_DN8256_c0_g1~~TRINITY_DN8256_c0_g1_i1.p1  ORF type:complete len:399 (-),score=40.95 TRINITY_DN8256_c0_g1_i1:55-1251(-)